jgi:hypothetical protein
MRSPFKQSTQVIHLARLETAHTAPRRQVMKISEVTDNCLASLLMNLNREMVVIELGAYAAYFGDRLPKPDRDRVLLAIRRFEALRGAIHARLK